MRVMITGGSGLIGRALGASLAGDGHEVVLLSRRPERPGWLPEGCRAMPWDGHSAAGWGELADGAGAIINLAGESLAAGRWTDDRKRRIRQSRLDAGAAVVEAVKAARVKPPVLVQASAVGYYGPHGAEEVAEDAPAGTGFLAGTCVDWEASTEPVEALGVRRIVVRTGVVLSMQGGALPRIMQPFKLFAGGPLGTGRQYLPWIHLADEVGAIRFLIDHPQAAGPFNLTAPAPLTNAGFTRVLGKAMHRPAFVRTPAFFLRLLFGEMSTVLLDGQRAVPRRLLEAGYVFRFPEAEAALGDLVSKR